MAKITIPQKNQQWQISYFGEFLGDVIETFNVNFHRKPGQWGVSSKLYPHTVTADAASIIPATSFLFSDAFNTSQTFKYVAAADKIYIGGATLATQFTADTSQNTPTNLTDTDIVVHGRSSKPSDILCAGSGINISRLDEDFTLGGSPQNWDPFWWTGLRVQMQTIVDQASGSPFSIQTAANHGFATSDTINIFSEDLAAGTPSLIAGKWTITVTGANTFTLDGSGSLTSGSGSFSNSNYVHQIYNSGNSYYRLGQRDLNASYPIILKVFGNGPALFVGNVNNLHSIGRSSTSTALADQVNDTDVVYKRVVFKKDFIINWIQVTPLKIYIGLKNIRGDQYQSLVEEYDPFSETVREMVIDEGTTIGYVWSNVLWIVDYKGNLKYLNGFNFALAASFPTVFMDGNQFNLPHRNGITEEEGRLLINIPTDSGTVLYRSGVWCYDPGTKQLYHQQAPVSGSASLFSYGSQITSAGAIFYAGNGHYLAGMSLPNVSPTAALKGIFSTSPPTGTTVSSSSSGYIITPKLKSSEIDTFFRNLNVSYNGRREPFGTSAGGTQSGSVITRYRVIDPSFDSSTISTTGTWTAANQFTTSDTVIASVGDEVIIWYGQGNGWCENISSIVTAGGSSRVTLVSSLPVTPTGSFAYTFDNFQKLSNDIITDASQHDKLIDLPEGANDWIQFKIEIQGFFDVDELQIGVEPNLKVEPPSYTQDQRYQTPQ